MKKGSKEYEITIVPDNGMGSISFIDAYRCKLTIYRDRNVFTLIKDKDGPWKVVIDFKYYRVIDTLAKEIDRVFEEWLIDVEIEKMLERSYI